MFLYIFMETAGLDSGEKEWIKRMDGYLSSLVVDAVNLLRSRPAFVSYARRIPPLINSGIIQFARDFPVYGLPDELTVRELRKGEEKPRAGLFLLVPEDWLLGVVLGKDGRQRGVAEITEKLITIIDVHDGYIRKGGEVFAREQIPDDDLAQMGVNLYSVSVDGVK